MAQEVDILRSHRGSKSIACGSGDLQMDCQTACKLQRLAQEWQKRRALILRALTKGTPNS